jgi:outer membrane receptor for ferrienterochelin and colicin
MTTIVRFNDIEAWQTARELTRQVYIMTHQGKFARDFGLNNQMQYLERQPNSIREEGIEYDV